MAGPAAVVEFDDSNNGPRVARQPDDGWTDISPPFRFLAALPPRRSEGRTRNEADEERRPRPSPPQQSTGPSAPLGAVILSPWRPRSLRRRKARRRRRPTSTPPSAPSASRSRSSPLPSSAAASPSPRSVARWVKLGGDDQSAWLLSAALPRSLFPL